MESNWKRKGSVGNCMEAGQGFEFLAYKFEAGQRWVRKKSLDALKDKIRRKTRRSRGDGMETIVMDVQKNDIGKCLLR